MSCGISVALVRFSLSTPIFPSNSHSTNAHLSSGTGAADPLEATVRNGHNYELKEILAVVEEFCVLGLTPSKRRLCFLPASGWFLALLTLLDPEDGGDILLRIIG
jgi:hypothetical protein